MSYNVFKNMFKILSKATSLPLIFDLFFDSVAMKQSTFNCKGRGNCFPFPLCKLYSLVTM